MAGTDDDRVVIRLKDVYDIARRTEAKVDLLTSAATSAQALAQDHEARLRTVERRVLSLPSLATLIALAALIVSIISVAARHTPATLPSSAPTRSTVAPVTVPSSTAPPAVVVVHRRSSSTSSLPPASSAPSPTSTSPRLISTPTSITVPRVTVPPTIVGLVDRIARVGLVVPGR